MQIGGAPHYLPPEIQQQKPRRGLLLDYAKSDVWAVGLILYELLADPGTDPYKCSGGKRMGAKGWCENKPKWQELQSNYTRTKRGRCVEGCYESIQPRG